MSGFFADEKNVSRFRRELLEQFSTTKKPVSTPTRPDANKLDIKNLRLGSTG